MPTASIPVQVIQPLQLTSGDGPFVLHDPLFDWHLLAEGDSSTICSATSPSATSTISGTRCC